MWIQCYRNIVSVRYIFPKSSHIYIFGLGQMTKMATMPQYGKFKDLLLQNHFADCHETWFVAFFWLMGRGVGGLFYNVFINDDPGLTMKYFTGRTNLVP